MVTADSPGAPYQVMTVVCYVVFYVQHFVLVLHSSTCTLHRHPPTTKTFHNLNQFKIVKLCKIVTSQKHKKGESRERACQAKPPFKFAVMRQK